MQAIERQLQLHLNRIEDNDGFKLTVCVLLCKRNPDPYLVLYNKPIPVIR